MIEPAAQSAHATVEAALYCPGMQAVHVVPATVARVSVIEPGPQAAQATVEVSLYWPASQAVQMVPAVWSRASVIEPGSQVAQALEQAYVTTGLRRDGSGAIQQDGTTPWRPVP